MAIESNRMRALAKYTIHQAGVEDRKHAWEQRIAAEAEAARDGNETERIGGKMNGSMITTEAKRFQDEQLAKAMSLDIRNRAKAKYHQAFTEYLVTGDDLELKDLRAGIDAAGGYLSGAQFMSELIDAEGVLSTMRRICRVLPPTTAESLSVPRQDSRFTHAGWTSELLTNGLDTSSPFGQVTFKPGPIAKATKVSKKLLRSGGAFAERVITEAIAEAVAVPQEAAFISGDGFNKPLGLLSTGLPAFTTASAGVLVIADVKNWLGSLPGRWQNTARVLTHVDTWRMFLALDVNGALIQNGLLLGKYVVEFSDQYPSFGTNPASITSGSQIAVIGDFSRYWIVDALNLSVQRVVELYAEAGEDGFIARQETDGQVVDVGAFKTLKAQ